MLAVRHAGGRIRHRAGVTVLALGGASWARLGSDGGLGAAAGGRRGWRLPLRARPSSGVVRWRGRRIWPRLIGQPLKAVGVPRRRAGVRRRGGDLGRGLEGGGIYGSSRAVREGARLEIDLAPDLSGRGRSPAASPGRAARPACRTTCARRCGWMRPTWRCCGNSRGPPRAFPRCWRSMSRRLRLRHEGLRPIGRGDLHRGGRAPGRAGEGLIAAGPPGVFPCLGEMLGLGGAHRRLPAHGLPGHRALGRAGSGGRAPAEAAEAASRPARAALQPPPQPLFHQPANGGARAPSA